ncbi:hypothetical protein K1719_005484 [Acacia pycnantha]|nr:hypothetical protein K1719_005484 [Acacia pycnantha]
MKAHRIMMSLILSKFSFVFLLISGSFFSSTFAARGSKFVSKLDAEEYHVEENVETIKIEHEKKATTLRKLEMKRADYVKTWKTKKEVEKLESHMMVASQAIESTLAKIIKLRETKLYQLLKCAIQNLAQIPVLIPVF